MSQSKMLHAYRTLLNHAKESVIKAENPTWALLGKAIEKAEQADHDLAELTAKEFEQVQKDLHADLMQTAEYLNEVEKGVEEFASMDFPILEQILLDKALSLADPTEITVLRLRLTAAMEPDHPIFKQEH